MAAKLDQHQNPEFIVIKTEHENNPNKFSIMSFNVLADCYVTKEQFPVAAQETLDFKNRAQKIVDFIHRVQPDIILLQEVDHYEDFYQHAFTQGGIYQFEYVPRPLRKDGQLTAWNAKKFSYWQTLIISFDDVAKKNNLRPTFLRQNIATLTELVHINSQRKLVVSNTHLFWDPNKQFIKFHQMLTLISELNLFYAQDKQQMILVGGDFNSTPPSNQIMYVTDRQPPKFQGLESSQNQQKQLQIMCEEFPRHKYSNTIQWSGAYRNYNGKDKYPLYTNYRLDWSGTIDHIFFRSGCDLILTKIMKLPFELVTNKGLPNEQIPSDHLPIMAEFCF